MTVRAAIIEMHVVQCADRLEESLAAAAAAPWWAIVRRPALLWRARAAARELTYWLERAEAEHGGEACTS